MSKHGNIRQKPQPTILGLPQELRLNLIEKYLPCPNDHLRLRAVCKTLQFEIDQVIGIRNTISYDKCSMEYPTIRQFITNVVIRKMQFNYKPDIFLNQILSEPCKLEFARLIGPISPIFLQEFLEQCLNLRSFSLEVEMFGSYLKPKRMEEFQFLKTLNVEIGSMMGKFGGRKQCEIKDELEIPFNPSVENALILLKLINAPRLTHLKYKLASTSNFNSLDISSRLLEFISRHDQIKSLELAVKVGYKQHRHMSVLRHIQQSTLENFESLVAPPLDENVLNGLKRLVERCKMSKNHVLENIAFDYDLDTEKDHHWMEYFGSLRNLKNLGLKLSGSYYWVDFCPMLDNNCLTLTKVYIQCYMRSSVDFNKFSRCTNLESISVHNIRGFDDSLIYMRNLSTGMDFLPKLESLILDGVTVSWVDMEDIAERKLKVLGLRSVSSKDYFGDDLVLHVEEDENQVSGISFEAFMKMVNNRHLDALLLDLDSISVTEFGEGIQIEKIRGIIFGTFRSFFLDFSDSDKFRYWKTSFLGFDVEFPFV